MKLNEIRAAIRHKITSAYTSTNNNVEVLSNAIKL